MKITYKDFKQNQNQIDIFGEQILAPPTPKIHEVENNPESQAILVEQKERLSKQCELVKKLLESGIRLTVRDAIINYGISSLPRRILDLKQYHNMEIKSQMIDKKYKEYFI